jgi:glyoxylase-like metal-dependent hydrolase (beta-lactamase superfamily II)
MRLAFGDFDMSPSVAAPLLMATMAKCDRRHLHTKYPQKRVRRPTACVHPATRQKKFNQNGKFADPRRERHHDIAMTPIVPGKCVPVAQNVRRIVAGNAGLMTGSGTNTYLIGLREVAVLDPGPDDARHLEAILAAAGTMIRWIIVTHTHPDHSPLVGELAKRTGARVIGLPPPDDGRQDATFAPEQLPGDGERLTLGDCRLIAIHTPGHASNCVCYLLEGERLLFTGDHVLEGVSPVILPPDGDMSAYLHSLDKLRSHDFERIAPGHGTVMQNGKEVLASLRAHRLAREEKVLRTLQRLAAATLEELTPVVYDDVAVERHRWARLTLEAHLIKLARECRASERDGVWRPSHP